MHQGDGLTPKRRPSENRKLEALLQSPPLPSVFLLELLTKTNHRHLSHRITVHTNLAYQWSTLQYRKIPKISPRAYIFQRPFLRGLYSEGLCMEGNWRFKIDWVSL